MSNAGNDAAGQHHAEAHETMRAREHLSVCPVCNLDLTRPSPPAPTHVLNEYGTTDCPVERVRAFADDGECSACGGRVGSSAAGTTNA